MAHLVATGEIAPTAEQVRRHLRTTLPSFMVPSRIRWSVALPRLPGGKIDRVTLRASKP